jgi:PPM family protein phosphatase
MQNNVAMGSLTAVGTITDKSENQDSVDQWEGSFFKCLVLADGLGSFTYAREASQKVCAYFMELFQRQDERLHARAFGELFKKVKQRLIDYSNEFFEDKPKEHALRFGTTAITLVETDDKITIAYTGNGSIWHIRGNFSEFPSSYLFPWNAVNYLNPHSLPENGREALYRLVSDDDHFEDCVPTVLEIEKDKQAGDIFMICTDGIFSADQVKTGKNDQGTWTKTEATMLNFFEQLKQFFIQNNQPGPAELKIVVEEYLQSVLPSIKDDASMGVLITKEALAFQKQVNSRKVNENYTSNIV